MNLYILDSEYEANKRKIPMAIYDRDVFSTPITINQPYTIKYIDEFIPENKNICREYAQNAIKGKYYSDASLNIYEVEGWVDPDLEGY